jgi:hypothetical protein
MDLEISLSEKHQVLLKIIAEDLGCSEQQALVIAIETFDAKSFRRNQLQEIFDIVKVRDKDLLDRLSDA